MLWVDQAEDVRPGQTTLEARRCFVVLEAVLLEGHTASQQPAVSWLVGQMLDHPVAQSVRGASLA